MKLYRGVTIYTVAALCALVGAFVLAPAASAQSAGADQYTPNPPGGGEEPEGGEGGQGPGGGGGGNPGGDQGPTGGGGGNPGDTSDALSPTAGTGQTDSGELPFTGYPLTTVLLVVLALLIVGTLIRVAVASRDRIRTDSGAGT